MLGDETGRSSEDVYTRIMGVTAEIALTEMTLHFGYILRLMKCD